MSDPYNPPSPFIRTSRYAPRIDPVTGRPKFHAGEDWAARPMESLFAITTIFTSVDFFVSEIDTSGKSPAHIHHRKNHQRA
jgi:hypothetical protein